jgi:hypothetical protein
MYPLWGDIKRAEQDNCTLGHLNSAPHGMVMAIIILYVVE